MQPKPVRVVLLHDVLCPWCYLADARLAAVREEYGDRLEFLYHPSPIRPEPAAPTRRERLLWARRWRRAAKEQDGARILPDLWLGGDPPHWSLPPLVALAAARVEGQAAHDRLLAALREAAFHQGLNITRRDVLLELAAKAGLPVGGVAALLASPRIYKDILDGQQELGVTTVPTLVIGGEWIVNGARPLAEYRALFSRYFAWRQPALSDRWLH